MSATPPDSQAPPAKISQMGAPPARSAQSALAMRRWRDGRRAIAIGSIILLSPLALSIFDRGTVLGVPSVVLFVFAVWLVGIAITRLFAKTIDER
ncbi:MAG: hypothetical protein AAF580_10430 [Pseudomonadota bacterium]